MGKILSHEQIGRKIKEFRLQAGLSQEKLAEALEITFQQVQKYEHGVTKVNVTKLQELARVFDVPVSAFFDETPHTAYQPTEQEVQLLKAFREIREDHLKVSVVEIVRGLSGRRK